MSEREPDGAWPPCDPDPWLTEAQEAYQQAQAADPLDMEPGSRWGPPLPEAEAG